jgi:Flp pilus assembly protein TadD
LSSFERGLDYFRAAQHDRAQACLRAATQEEPGNPQAWRYLAAAHFSVSDFAGAEEPARQCTALTPGDPAAHLNLAIILRKLGRWDEARAELDECLRLRPEYRAAQTELRKHDTQTPAPQPWVEEPEFEPLSE